MFCFHNNREGEPSGEPFGEKEAAMKCITIMLLLIVTLALAIDNTGALQHSDLSNIFTLDTRDETLYTNAMQHSALSNTFILDTRDKIYIGALEHSALSNTFTLDTRVYIKGDVNGDGKIRSNDAILALRMASGLIEPDDDQKLAADMNDDGKVRSNDAILILRIAAGLAAPDRGVSVDGHISISIPEIHGVKGETITAPIKVSGTDALAGGDIVMIYNPSVLKAVNVSSYDNMLMAYNTRQPGTLRISFADVAGLNSETVAQVQFEVMTDDVSPLELKAVELYRNDASPVVSTKLSGRFVSWAVPPDHSALLQNFPNPFNPETWIPYQLKDDSHVAISIYNSSGQHIRTLDLGHRQAGLYFSKDRAAYWDGRNESGELVSSGVYFYTIQSGNYTATRKMTLSQ
jgi:hypothetical protein